jgi:hypothetical protein
MEWNEMKIFFGPEIFYGLEASIRDTEARDGNGGFVEAGEPLIDGG